MKLKHQIEQLLAQNNMNPTQLSRKANVPRQTIANWLMGQSPKNLDQVKRVADLFKMSLDHLLYGVPPNSIIKSGQSIKHDLIGKRFEIRIVREIDDT